VDEGLVGEMSAMDIIERLRRRADDSENQELDREAIAEIEKLRAVLKHLYYHGYVTFGDHDMVKSALGISDEAA
jgi:hypothetical protein